MEFSHKDFLLNVLKEPKDKVNKSGQGETWEQQINENPK